MNIHISAPTTKADEYFIRRAVRSDIPELSALVANALSTFRGDVPDNALRLYIEHARNFAERWERGHVLVAQQYGRILGTATFYMEAGMGLPADWASFGTLAVHPQMQGRGVGSVLVGRCIAAASRIAPAVGIHTGSFMRPARRMYEAIGFARAPAYDLTASAILDLDPAEGDVDLLAYRLDLDTALSG
jgi:GNAT superfamily N-acetyltransferase